jgi:hypothetical protein
VIGFGNFIDVEWTIISARNADNLKTREKKKRLRSAIPDRESRHFEKNGG